VPRLAKGEGPCHDQSRGQERNMGKIVLWILDGAAQRLLRIDGVL
jgi:hypothetical protein